jgi:putative Mg2+ transporter-C (MgtC) family protein
LSGLVQHGGDGKIMDSFGQALANELGGVGLIMPLEVVVIRLLGAVLLCGLIGFEREWKQQSAGLRTHILVGLAAGVYSIIALEIVGQSYDESVKLDPLRIVEAVTGGVAFLAAGLIVFHNGQVKGLTTGAGMWLAASVGLCAGLGLWGIAVLATALSLIVMILLTAITDRFLRTKD